MNSGALTILSPSAINAAGDIAAYAPAQLEPLDAASPYRAVSKTYSTISTSTYDVSTKTLIVPLPGYTVIRYLLAPEVALGGFPDSTTHANYFQVVRSVVWNDPAYLLGGRPPLSARRSSIRAALPNSPKSGWTVFERGPYDGAGNEAVRRTFSSQVRQSWALALRASSMRFPSGIPRGPPPRSMPAAPMNSLEASQGC